MKSAKIASTKGILSLAAIFLSLFAVVATPVYAKSTSDKIKDAVDDASDSVKKGVDKLGDNLAAAQEYLENYSWKGIVQDKATSGEITLSHLKMNGHRRVVLVKPGEKVSCKVDYFLDPNKVSDIGFYRAVIGIKGIGPQTTACNCLGAAAGEGHSKFTLTAPTEPGMYQIRFRTVNKYLEKDALDCWLNENGDEPDASTTIGIIYVKS